MTSHQYLARVARALSAHVPTEAERDPPFREASVALVLSPLGDDAEVLLMRRSTHPADPWSDQVALPGGRFEPGDMSLMHTAMREAAEETRIALAADQQVGALDELRPRTPSLPPIIVRPYVFVIGSRQDLAPSDEVAEVFWAPVQALFDPAHRERASVRVRGLRMQVDAINFEGRIIWGMTERILRSFERVVEGG